MRIECVDVETFLMQDGEAAPKLVCLSWSDGTREKLLVPWEGEDPHAVFAEILRRRDTLLINQHIFFDLGVMCATRPDLLPLVFEALAEGRIRCVKVREQLIRIARGEAKFVEEFDDGSSDEDDGDDAEGGNAADDPDAGGEEASETGSWGAVKTRFDLAAIAKRWLGIKLRKEGTWRKSYALLYRVPLRLWPPSAVEYPLSDARVPLQVWSAQQAWVDRLPGGVLPGEIEANCAAWALHLMKIWGVRTCAEAVAKLTLELQHKVLWTTIALVEKGILRPEKKKGVWRGVETKAVVQQRVVEAYVSRGLKVQLTPPTKTFPQGQVKTGKKVLDDSKNAVLMLLGEHKGYTKILSTYIPKYVAKGIRAPITADWNVLVESFRISCARPNLTNPPRAGDVRRCIIARKGHLFVSADFDQAELRSWAQVCLAMFKFSTMAEAFKREIDPHLKLAAELMHISLEEAAERYKHGDKLVEARRQFCKEPNFGLIGGMGWRKFKERAELKGIYLTDEQAEQTRWMWMKAWAEAKPYLDYFAKHYDKPGVIVHPITGFIRGGVGYSDGANHCVDFETEALTRRGWLTGDQLTLNDEILTKNAVTGELEWQRPTAINRYPEFNGPLFEITHNAVSAVTTSNHRWLVYDRRKKQNTCVLTEDFLRSGERSSCWKSIHRCGVMNSQDAPFSDDFIELVGWFLTDGYAEKTPGSSRIRIYQTKKQNVVRIDELLTRLGIRFTRNMRRGENVVWSFTNKKNNDLATVLRELFPVRELNSSFVSQLSRRQAQLLVRVMLLGDGSQTASGQTQFYTRSERNADAFQFLLVLAGMASRGDEIDRTGEIGRFSLKMRNIPKMGKSWRVSPYRRQFSQITRKQIRETHGDGRGVWCPSVPNGFFVARRKKKVYVTGNSFQHLTAIGAKQALIDLTWECHLNKDSPIYGARPIIHMHDEIFGEILEHRAAAGAVRWGEVMRKAMEKWVRDVPIKCTPVLTRRMYKGAKPVTDAYGNLVPSKPVEVEGKIKWVHDERDEGQENMLFAA